MAGSTAQGRYFLSDYPVASPGQCGVCGYSGPDRTYLDPRLDFEFYGSLIFCSECVASMAEVMGYIEPAQARSLENRVEEAERELISLRAAVSAVEEFKRAIGIPVGPSTDIVGVLVDDEPVVSIIAEGQQELPFNSDRSEGPDDSGPDEQVTGSRRNDLRDADPSAEFGVDFL